MLSYVKPSRQSSTSSNMFTKAVTWLSSAYRIPINLWILISMMKSKSIKCQGTCTCTGEAIWRILKFNINEHYPSVEKLAVHLKNGQRIYFNDTEQAHRIVANDPPQMTLMAFFKLCYGDDFIKILLYAEVPSYFTWRDKKWNQRKKGILVDSHISYFKSDQLEGSTQSIPRTENASFSGCCSTKFEAQPPSTT